MLHLLAQDPQCWAVTSASWPYQLNPSGHRTFRELLQLGNGHPELLAEVRLSIADDDDLSYCLPLLGPFL